MILALLALAGAALGVWFTIDPGQYRVLAWVLLGFFAFRVLIGRARQRQSEIRTKDGL